MASSLPDWTLLDPFIFQIDDDDSFPTDHPTVACSTNSRGDQIRVCVLIEEPPRPSRFLLLWPAGTEPGCAFEVVAVHRDAVLFQNTYPVLVPGGDGPFPLHEYFIYRPAGGFGGGSRPSPPSLILLPPIEGDLDELRELVASGRYKVTRQHLRRLMCLDIAMLCRGGEEDDKDEIVVAELEPHVDGPQLHIFRYGRSSKWEHRCPQVTFHDNSDIDLDVLTRMWYADAVVPAGTCLLWFDYCLPGLLYCNVFDGSSDQGTFNLHYVPLPARLYDLFHTDHPFLYHAVSFSEELSVVKFVMVSNADCRIVRNVFGQAQDFKVSSWTLKISAQEMVWEADAVVTSDELWKLDGFAQLPHQPLEFPLVSMVNPSIVYFVLRQEASSEKEYQYHETWLVAIDMHNKSLESVFAYIDGRKDKLSPQEAEFIQDKYCDFEPFIPAEFPKYMKQILSRHGKRKFSQINDATGGRASTASRNSEELGG